jgi:hypothetical protein
MCPNLMFTGAYVTQGPRSHKDAPATVPAPGFPGSSAEMPPKIPSSGTTDQHSRTSTFPDVYHVALQPVWSPPTPFSLPATPRQSPFVYPADVPDYEFVDARLLGYDPKEWPEFESQMANSRRMPLPQLLDNYVLARQGRQTDFEASLLLTSISITVHFATQASHIEGVSPSLMLGRHQLAYMPQENTDSLQMMSIGGLDKNTRELVQATQAGSRLYHVDLPVHLPTEAADRAYLAQDAGPEYHVKCRVEFHAGGPTSPHDEELKAVSKVYFFSGQEKDHNPPELLEGYQEVTSVTRPQEYQPGVLVTHGLATLFAGKLWGDSVEELKSSDAGKLKPHLRRHIHHLRAPGADLSRYRIVQNILPRSHKAGTKPLLTIVYSPRLVKSPKGSTVRLVMRDPTAQPDPVNVGIVYGTASRDNTPSHTPLLHPKQPSVTLRRSSRSGSTPGMERHTRHVSKTPLLQSILPSDTAGPVRNTRSQSRNRSLTLMRRPVAAPSPLAGGVKLPPTPRTSPLISMQQPRRNSVAPTFVQPTYNSFADQPQSNDFATYGPITSQTPETAMFDADHVDGWSSLMGVSGSFPLNTEMVPTYDTSSSSLWPYPRDGSGEVRRQVPLASNFHASQLSELPQNSFPTHADHLLYYNGASWS